MPIFDPDLQGDSSGPNRSSRGKGPGVDTTSPNPKANQPYLLDMETCEILLFQTVPLEINYNPELSWQVIAAPGRNNPRYHYTGGEDTLSFSLTYYADTDSREDVLRSCKHWEALGKNDGYGKKPHRIKLMFGGLFNDVTWIVFSCPTKYSMFSRPKKMLPTLAIQEITLKRVMENNSTTSYIRKIDT